MDVFSLLFYIAILSIQKYVFTCHTYHQTLFFYVCRFWGKFGQASGQTKTEYVCTPEHLFKLLTDEKVNVQDFHILNDLLIQVDWTEDEDFAAPSSFQNIFIACFTTVHARIKLYSLLDELKGRALYCDTDSVVYTVEPGKTKLPLGDYLGELTNELQDGDHITEFVSTGPKAYAYKTLFGHTSTKLKGFTLNYTNSQQVNFASMKRLVENGGSVRTVNPSKICRNVVQSIIYSVHEEKNYKVVYDKRVRQQDNTTLPYGY